MGLKRVFNIANLPILLAVTILYTVYSLFVIKPNNLQHFSLVDDGQVLLQSSEYFENCIYKFNCRKFFDQTLEFGSSRFRPVYWILANINFELFKLNATNYHIFRVFILGTLSVLLISMILIQLKVRWSILIIGSMIYFTSFSFTENIIRLGTNEPYQVALLAVFSIIYLQYLNSQNFHKLLFPLSILVLVTILIKESDIVILPVIFLIEYLYIDRKIFTKRILFLVLIPLLIFVTGFLVTLNLPSEIAPDIPIYGSNYLIHPVSILKNILPAIGLLMNNVTSLFKFSLFLIPIIFLARSRKNIRVDSKIAYWVIFASLFIFIQLPWRFVLDRYFLVIIFSVSVITATILSKVLTLAIRYIRIKLSNNKYFLLVVEMIVFILVMNIFSRGFSVNLAKSINYSRWYSEFISFEADQVKALAEYNNKGIYINALNNINNWEFLYEVPIHLKYLHSMHSQIGLHNGEQVYGKYIFSRTSFDSFQKLEDMSKDKSKLIVSKTYKIDQIDPLAFRDKFIMRPIETILNPPLQKVGYDYYWEIRQVLK